MTENVRKREREEEEKFKKYRNISIISETTAEQTLEFEEVFEN